MTEVDHDQVQNWESEMQNYKWSSNSTSKYIPKRSKNRDSHALSMNVYNTKSQWLGGNTVSISSGMDKQNQSNVYIHSTDY